MPPLLGVDERVAAELQLGRQLMPHHAKEEPTRQLLLQRIRNRIIEYLELASSFEAQREYQQVAPVHVPNEVINQWEDWVQAPRVPAFAEPVFSRPEQEAVAAFYGVWQQVAADTPDPLPPLETLQATAEWQRLRSAAVVALAVFAARGRLSEEEELE